MIVVIEAIINLIMHFPKQSESECKAALGIRVARSFQPSDNLKVSMKVENCPNMTEKLLTGMSSINTIKQQVVDCFH